MVRAKFQVNKLEILSNEQVNVHMNAVSGEDNKSWSKWTPSGNLSISITNPEASKQFEVGKSYYLDFSPVPDAPPAQ